MVSMTIQVWKALIDAPAYESDREACFKWFARVSVCVCVCVCVRACMHVCVGLWVRTCVYKYNRLCM